MKKLYRNYVTLVYKTTMLIASYIALNIAAALTLYDGEFEVTIEKLEDPDNIFGVHQI